MATRITKKRDSRPEGQQKSQISAFKQLAREIGADESETAFDKALGKIGRALPQPKPKKKKRKPLKLAL